MNRFGISWKEFDSFLKEYKTYLKRLKVSTVFSHLVDGANERFSSLQESRFLSSFEKLRRFLGYSPLSHIHSSSGVLYYLHKGKSFSPFNLVRFGILLYGIAPSLETLTLKKAMGIRNSLKLKVKPLLYRKVGLGEHLGYSCNVAVPSDVEKVAILPVGYNELPRRISGYLRFRVLWNRKIYQLRVLGNICMDCLFLEYPLEIPESLELEAFFDGEWEEVADSMETVPHELLLRVASAVEKRVTMIESSLERIG